MEEISTLLSKAKSINQQNKDIVNGYLRNLTQLLSTQSTLVLPSLILYLCLIYFYDGNDWDETLKGLDIIISSNKRIENMARDDQTIVDKNIY